MNHQLAASAIGIVIPHYNRASLLKVTLASLENQSFRNWIAVVVDDGSDAEEWHRIQEFANAKITIIRRENGEKGPSHCRNLGWKLLRTPYIMFLDSDDCLAPWCLEERLKFAGQQPTADAWVFPVMLFRDKAGDLDFLWNQLDGDDDLIRFLKSDPPWHTSSPLWKISTLENVGGFNDHVMYGDDADLHIRALMSQCTFAKASKALPDTFVRRANHDRITNTISDRLLESRVARLRQLTPLIRSKGTEAQKCAWQGQYFVECEFILFRTENPNAKINELLKAWHIDWDREQIGRTICNLYLSFGQFSRKRFYIMLRIARRIAKVLLPRDYFPTAGTFENTCLNKDILKLLKNRLQVQPHLRADGDSR